MTLLEAINLCLRSTGETRVSTINSAHPQIATILESIHSTSRLIQSKGWWFNEQDDVLLEPETSGPNAGLVLTPANATMVMPVLRNPRDAFYPMGTLLQWQDGTGPVDKAVRARVRVEFPTDENTWDELPPTFTEYVGSAAALDYASNYDADPAQIQKIQLRLGTARASLTADEIRYRRPNLYYNGSQGYKIGRAWAQRYTRTI